MNLFVNGEKTSMMNVTTVSELLSALEVQGNIAVEINKNIISRSAFDCHMLTDGDEIEIVTAIGGG